MAKKPEEIKPGLPAWQGTFGDLMNLLLCFFVLLFSMATMDAAKFEEVAASFSSALIFTCCNSIWCIIFTLLLLLVIITASKEPNAVIRVPANPNHSIRLILPPKTKCFSCLLANYTVSRQSLFSLKTYYFGNSFGPIFTVES